MIVQRIEELSMNALPALDTNLYDGWVLRFSNGYTKRANSINPIYLSSIDVKSKIKAVEQQYLSRGLQVVYKITEYSYPNDLEESLKKAAYRMEGETSVQVLELDNYSEKQTTNVEIFNGVTDKWLSSFYMLNGVEEIHRPILRKILQRINGITYYALITGEKGTVLSCGLGVLEGEYIGLYDIVTNREYRNRGYGTEVLHSLLNLGREQGAKYAYLQVVSNNLPARKLYSKLGFVEKYKYWYRIKKE